MKNYTYETATGPVLVELDEIWLKLLSDADDEEVNADRRHTRSDHKYAPGRPISLDNPEYGCERYGRQDNAISSAEFSVDLESALSALTELQRRYFVMFHIEDYTYAEIARRGSKDASTVREIVKTAQKKIKNILNQHPLF